MTKTMIDIAGSHGIAVQITSSSARTATPA
jgi:hypothetical protein